MRDKQKLKQSLDILAIRTMLKHEAEQALESMRLTELQKSKEEEAAQLALEDAASTWNAYIDQHGMDPVRLRLLIDVVDIRSKAFDLAQAATRDARSASDAGRGLLASRNADLSQAETLVDHYRRRVARTDAERALSRAEERVAYRWVVA